MSQIELTKKMMETKLFQSRRSEEEKNAENLLIIRNNDLAIIYVGNWEEYRKHSEIYEGR